jgi:zinc transport system ATP-binding protein
MPSIIEANKVQFKYTRTLVLDKVSFEVQAGDYVGIIGPNGGGKTTLLKLILGLEKGAGEIKLFGTPIGKFSQWEKIGYLAQKSPVSQARFPICVQEVVLMGLCYDKTHKEATPENLRKVRRALSQTHTLNLSKRIFSDLSVGQQQRVLLARALVSEPQLLILDEPSAALDANSREMFFTLLGKLNRQNGVTILLITHDTGEVGKYISKFMYIDRELVFFGNKEEFCHSEKVAEKLGAFAQHTIDHLHNHGHCPLGCSCVHNAGQGEPSHGE